MQFQHQPGRVRLCGGTHRLRKTTFLNTLTCLIPPTSGEILIDGEPADPKKHNLSFVFQEPSAMPWLTVEDNIAFGMKPQGLGQKTGSRQQTDKIIELMA